MTESDQTIAPGEKIESLTLVEEQGTSDVANEDEFEYTAPVRIPAREKLARSLVLQRKVAWNIQA